MQAAGKSTMAAGLFYRLKSAQQLKVEYVQEYAKDLAWKYTDAMGEQLAVPDFAHQEYIFAKQLARMRRLIGKVDYIITDSPLLLGNIYMPDNFEMPSLCHVIWEAHEMFENYNFFIERKKDYDPSGRLQTESEAIAIDEEIKAFLARSGESYSDVSGTPQGLDWLYSGFNPRTGRNK